ncbi:MAG: hypothetical protein LV481_02170 [Methylacidiphilales bacterium]|nr:hypothetical protein [Candidatus Methylacidiphilales bacterium]
MKRFLKVLTLLVIALFALVSGVDVTLDHISRAVTQSAFTCYDQTGRVVANYKGDLALCPLVPKPQPLAPANALPRPSFTPSVD